MHPFRFTPSWILSRRVSSFQRFFELGQEESASPFLDARAKRISRNIALKSAVASAILLGMSWFFRFYIAEPFWPIPLSFVYLLAGTPFLIAAVDDVLVRHDVNIDVLNTSAAFGALAIGSPMEGALLLVLFTLAASLEDLVTLKAKSTLCAINEIAPTKAYVVESGGQLLERAVDDVKVGETIAVRAGEVVPLDGVVRKGQASVSMAHMTGESRPLFVGVSQAIASGARILDGSIEVEVQVTGHDSTVTKLIGLITRAHSSKPKLSQTFDRYGRIYAMCVIGITFFLMVFFPLVLNIPFYGDEGGVVRAISFLITASPCALILAVPITYLSALGASARKGAILKGSMILDRVRVCGAVAFDKTGTLTEGRLEVEKVLALTGGSTMSDEKVLSYAASVERHAVHPVARAIVDAFSLKQLPLLDVDHVQVIPGEGVLGTIHDDGKEISIFIGGMEGALRRLGEGDEEARRLAGAEQADGKVVAAVVIQNRELFLFVLSDTIRIGSADVVNELKGLGKQVVMLTGDHAESAQRIGASLGIDEVCSALLPEQKVEFVAALSRERGVLMVGDGINDAPALSRATVGVSMGQLSSAAAREASDVVLLNNDLAVIPWLFGKSVQTHRIVIQNLVIAFAAILIGTTTSLQGILPLWVAVTIHEGSTLIVGMNALRLLTLGTVKVSNQQPNAPSAKNTGS